MADTDALRSKKIELLVLTDNSAFARKSHHLESRLIVSTSPQAAAELKAAGLQDVFDIGEFSEKRFSDLDELCDHYRPLVEKTFRPSGQDVDREAFDSIFSSHVHFWSQVLYFDEVLTEIRRQVNPGRIEVGIQYNGRLQAILRGLTRNL